MDHTGEDSPAKINMTKGQKGCQSQVKNLIKKLASWRDESHRQMSDIISSHGGSIDKGFSDLAEEFSDMQAHVSVLEKERNVLLETINNLNGEIRQMSAKLPLAGPEVLEFDSPEVDIPDLKEECVESLRIHSEAGDEEEYVDYGDILDESAQHKNRYPIDDHASTVNEFDNVDVDDSDHVGADTDVDVTQDKDIVTMLEQRETQQNKGKWVKESTLKPPNRTIESTEFVCKVCKFAFSTSENLQIHSKNIHSKFDLSSVRQVDNEESKEQSDLSITESAFGVALERHVNDVHGNKKRYACEECAYASSRKNMLQRHWDAVHNKGEKKYKCEKCPYSSAERPKLKYHMVSVHNMGVKFKCDECPYSSADSGNLKRHIVGVHKSENLRIHSGNVHLKLEPSSVSLEDEEDSKELSDLSITEGVELKDTKMLLHQKLQNNSGDKKLKCEQCSYQASQKWSINRHIRDVHDKIKNHVCDECGYASSEKNMMERHWDAVHNKGDKKFKCEHCPYSSAKKSMLKYHMISVHNIGEKLICEECGYAATTKSILEKHWDAVHNKGDKRFKCEKCPYSSAQSTTLKYHMISVHNIGEKLKCEECGYAAIEKGDLRRHRINVHKKGTI